MKAISDYKEINGNASSPSLKSGIGVENHYKNAVLEHMKKIEAEVVQARSMMDYISGTTLHDSVECFTDGEYFWTSEEIYHFEKYNLKLNDDFIQYVLNRPE